MVTIPVKGPPEAKHGRMESKGLTLDLQYQKKSQVIIMMCDILAIVPKTELELKRISNRRSLSCPTLTM